MKPKGGNWGFFFHLALDEPDVETDAGGESRRRVSSPRGEERFTPGKTAPEARAKGPANAKCLSR